MNEQRTEQWFADRLGCLTASRLADALDFTAKGAEGAKRKQYRLELIAERLTGQKTEFFENFAMRWGTEKEPEARLEYEFLTDNSVTETGFIKHPLIEWAGASPDGLIGADGAIEIKCPTSTTHLQWMLAGVVPEQHIYQMLWQMACSGRKWCDFVSFDPRMPEGLRLFIRRFEPAKAEIKAIETQAIEFLLTVNAMCAEIENIGTLKLSS